MRKLIVLLVAAAFLVAMGLPAMAADKSVTFYGSARVMTYIQDRDKENTGKGYDDTDLVWSLDDGSSRVGAIFKAGKIGGQVEIRPRDRQSTRTRTMSTGGARDLMRHWYGSYDFGVAKLIVGQTWAPTFHPISHECMLGGGGFLDGYGDMGGTASAPGLQIWVPVKGVNGMFKLALLEPYTDPEWDSLVTGYTSDTDTSLPKIEASLNGGFGPLSFNIRGGYNTFDVVNATDNEESIDSWLLAADAGYSFGAFYVKGVYYRGQNLSVYGTGGPEVIWGLFPQAFTGTNVEDVDNWGVMGVVGFRFNDKISIEGGWGTRRAEQDYLTGEIKDKKSAFYAMLPITIAKGFTMTPEVLITDEDECTGPSPAPTGVTYSADRGHKSYYGVYWRIDF